MSSGDDWTHRWILTNMSPSNSEANIDKPTDNNDIFHAGFSVEDPLGIADAEIHDEGTSPVNSSIDLDRDSPMACALDDEEDTGPPSIETQPPEHVDDLEVANITSSWINSGGHYGDSMHPGLGYERSSAAYDPLDLNRDSEHVAGASTGLGGGDCNNEEFLPVFGPSLPMGPCNSPVQENGPLMYGDVIDEGASSGLCGLRNLGNTCFMAAGIQCLVNTPPIAQYFFKHQLDSEEDKSTLAGRFSQLTHKMWSGKYSSLRPAEFKEAFGQHWRDFRDYRQHDCQEFMTLLLEALRKQMPIDENADSIIYHSNQEIDSAEGGKNSSRESGLSSSPTPPQSPQCSLSPLSTKQTFDARSDMQEDIVGLDSGTASPKSSISSSSVDAHLISLRLQPIPEEVKNLNQASTMDVLSSDEVSVSGNMSCQDAESVASDGSDLGEAMQGCLGVAGVRRYNQFPLESSDSISENTLGVSPEAAKSSTSEDLKSKSNLSDSWSACLNKNALHTKNSSSNSHLSLVNLEDIMKETKTSNVNVLALDNVPNNELLYDSEKYARVETKKIKNSVDNLNRYALKRVKEVNLLVDKMDNSQINSSGLNKHIPSSGRNSIVSRRGVEYQKNDLSDRRLPVVATSTSAGERVSEEQRLADESWKSFVGEGKSAVVNTFYGQFKSSLVCSVCGHTSIKFDPFGTLSVPLPHANEIQISVTYVPIESLLPTRCLLTLLKVSTVADIKNALSKLFGPTNNEVVITEVFDNHIARTVDDSYLIKFLNHSLRDIYAFELVQPPLPIEDEKSVEETENLGNKSFGSLSTLESSSSSSANTAQVSTCSTSSVSSGNISDPARWQSCNICLEELCQTELRTHRGCEDCGLCENCIEMTIKHHGGGKSIPCPVCQTQLTADSLIPVAKRKAEKPKARILRVPVVFRVDTESDDNNKREMALVGHPALLSLPSRIKVSTLQKIIEKKLSLETQFSLLFVEGRGYNCSRCLFSSHCRGCDALKDAVEVTLQAGDTLCVRFTSLSNDQIQQLASILEHDSLLCMRQNAPLTIYDCLRAFTQSETLEENDSWFCPKCERKQQATKTISVWKYPPYLIIHLERFLFHGAMSSKLDDKVIFPLDRLDLSPFVSGGDNSTPLLYNLYSSVCHMGVAQAGHYTAYVRSPVTNEWHYFNDDNVTRQKLREEDFSTSYLLFYHKQGTNFNLSLPQDFSYMDFGPNKSTTLTSENEIEGCRKRFCLQRHEEGDRRAIATSFFVGEERIRKTSSKASDSSTNSDQAVVNTSLQGDSTSSDCDSGTKASNQSETSR